MNEMTEIVIFSQATAAPAAASAASAAPSAAGYAGASDPSPRSSGATAVWSSVGASNRWFINSYDYYSYNITIYYYSQLWLNYSWSNMITIARSYS